MQAISVPLGKGETGRETVVLWRHAYGAVVCTA
jgi:hypothetical protein